LTVDLEDWRCALDPRPDADYRHRPSIDVEYVRNATARLLHELDRHGAKATFFVLGEVAEAAPEVVKEISNKGHEIASHSPVHLPPKTVPRDDFTRLIKRDLGLLGDLSGKRVIGFRSPYFSITRQDGWLLALLADQGIMYDSSVVPTWTPYWGIPSAPKSPYFPDLEDLANRKESGRIVEIPVTVWPAWNRLMGLPIGGGFYMRAWPTPFLLRAMRRNVRSGHPLVVYIHPGNLESDKEKVSSPSTRDRLSQYALAGRGASTFRRLLETFRFGTISEVFSSTLASLGRG
jgi:polysaccharide deacetylase family protein (PEP-CTERM system associated)